MKKPELIAPGGSLEKIEYVYHFGADAVYCGLPDFSLRARINEFTPAKIKRAVKTARGLNKKIYFTLNIFAHERHLPKIKKHLDFVKKVKPDAIIVSDPGIVSLARKIAPKIKIHLSTQANTTNSEAVKFWEKQGVSRIILAREITLEEIKKIRKAVPGMEIECFVHGAMCMSYSGRCLLSQWIRGRSANLGDCVQPCRWKIKLKSKNVMPRADQPLAEKSRKILEDHLFSIDNEKDIAISEDEHGTYLLNSKDLCLIGHLDALAKAGVNAFKIEGRTKSVYYAALATKAYRRVLEGIRSKKSGAEIRKISREVKKELGKIVNRGYSTGFLFGKERWENDFERSHRENKWQFAGETLGFGERERVRLAKSLARSQSAPMAQFNRIKAHNALKEKENVEIITPKCVFSDKILEIRNENGEVVKSAHGGNKSVYFLKLSRIYPEKLLIRKRVRA